MSKILKYGFVAVIFAATLSMVSGAFAQGVDVLRGGGGAQPHYVTDDMLLNADKDPMNWLHYGKDYQSTRYHQATQINQGNAGDLVAKWYLSFGTLEGQDSQLNVVGGQGYVTTSFNRVISVDTASGDIIWKYERELPADVYPELCCDVVNRGATPYGDSVYLATLDSHLVRLANHSGEVLFDVAVGDYTYAETSTIMPMALSGGLIQGTAGAEYGVRGWVRKLSAEDGSVIWNTYTIPAEGEPNVDTWAGESWKYGGGSGWVTGSYDKDLDLLYWPIGNPGPDFDRHVRLGDNLYSNSTLVLNPNDGAIVSWFQYTPNDPYDYDGVNEVILADIDGKKVWLHGDRNGHLYSIDRTNSRCNWVVAMGKINWTPGFRDNCRPIMAWEEGGDPAMDVVYDRVTLNIYPSLDGGKEWHPMCYSPRVNAAVVPLYNFSMDLQAKKMEWRRGEWYLGAKVITFNSGNGSIKAFNASNGDLMWIRPHSTPATGGTLCTAGGLVFYGDAEGYFHAVRDDTGEELFQFNVGTGVHGNPTTYTVDGQQQVSVVVGAGGGGIWPLSYGEWLKKHTKGGGVFTFGLN